MGKDIFKDQRLLTRFVRQLCALPDTPALIQFIAGDEDYLLLCSKIVNASAGDARVFQHLKEIGRKHGLDFQILKEKLTPAAIAIGLAGSPENQSDYYELLGVPRDADTADIKKAFRKRVRKVHPDTSAEMTDSGQEFIHLKAAYQILTDPVLRQQYDESLHDDKLWKEKADQTVIQKRPNRTKIFYQLGVLFLLMVLAVFILDFLYRQTSIFDDDAAVKQKQVTEPKTLKEDRPKKSNIKPKPQNMNTNVKLLRYPSGSGRKILHAKDKSPNTSSSFHMKSADLFMGHRSAQIFTDFFSFICVHLGLFVSYPNADIIESVDRFEPSALSFELLFLRI